MTTFLEADDGSLINADTISWINGLPEEAWAHFKDKEQKSIKLADG